MYIILILKNYISLIKRFQEKEELIYLIFSFLIGVSLLVSKNVLQYSFLNLLTSEFLYTGLILLFLIGGTIFLVKRDIIYSKELIFYIPILLGSSLFSWIYVYLFIFYLVLEKWLKGEFGRFSLLLMIGLFICFIFFLKGSALGFEFLIYFLVLSSFLALVFRFYKYALNFLVLLFLLKIRKIDYLFYYITSFLFLIYGANILVEKKKFTLHVILENKILKKIKIYYQIYNNKEKGIKSVFIREEKNNSEDSFIKNFPIIFLVVLVIFLWGVKFLGGVIWK